MSFFNWGKKEEKPVKAVKPKAKPKAPTKAKPKAAPKAVTPLKPAKSATKTVAKKAKAVPKATKKIESKAVKQPAAPAKVALQQPASQTPAVQVPSLINEKEARQKVQEGWVRALITFELVGKPREHIENTLKAYIENIKLDPRIKGIKEETAEALEHEDGMFSAFTEFEAVAQDMETLTWLAINFLPASIEILEPEHLPVDSRVATNWYNDLLSKLHETSTVLREERAVNNGLTVSMNALIKNALLACLRSGPKQPKELEALLGIQAEQLEPFLKHFIEKGTVKEQDGSYSL